MFLGAIFAEFHAQNPGITMDIVLMDRSVNPLEEGFDLVVGALPASYPNVTDFPLGPYSIALCASPSYVEAKGAPESPNELIDHDCCTSQLDGHAPGPSRTSRAPRASKCVPKMHANDNRVLRDAALRGVRSSPCCRDSWSNDDLEGGTAAGVDAESSDPHLLDEGAGTADQTEQAGRFGAGELPEGTDAADAAVGSADRARQLIAPLSRTDLSRNERTAAPCRCSSNPLTRCAVRTPGPTVTIRSSG